MRGEETLVPASKLLFYFRIYLFNRFCVQLKEIPPLLIYVKTYLSSHSQSRFCVPGPEIIQVLELSAGPNLCRNEDVEIAYSYRDDNFLPPIEYHSIYN